MRWRFLHPVFIYTLAELIPEMHRKTSFKSSLTQVANFIRDFIIYLSLSLK